MGLRGKVWVQVWTGVSGCQYRWGKVGEQVRAHPYPPAEAAGCDPEEWGPQKRGYSL